MGVARGGATRTGHRLRGWGFCDRNAVSGGQRRPFKGRVLMRQNKTLASPLRFSPGMMPLGRVLRGF